ncbi:MAG: type II toxin-antitoxin system VapC family toxin [Synergistaceae bacterium]|nr:type II toxin-antitoxin system VapC family toxin [Synergistaceae bacterium]
MNKFYYLDSNIRIFYMRGRNESLFNRVNAVTNYIKLPSIVKAELLTGAMKSVKPDQELERVMTFCEPFEIVPFDDSMTKIYGEIRADLGRIGFNDLIIAATVKSLGCVLVTNNINEFSRINGLFLDDWTL